MKKTIFSTLLFILFLLFIAISFLSFFGYETNRFNQVIKSEINKNQKNLSLDFDKISVLLDIKKLTLFVKFTNPKINYFQTPIPLSSLRTDIHLKPLINKKIEVKRVVLGTNFIDFEKIKPLIKKSKFEQENFKRIKSLRFKIKKLELEFNENFELKENYKINGVIDTANIFISKEDSLDNLTANFSYIKNNINLKEISASLKNKSNKDSYFSNGSLILKINKKNYEIDLNFETNEISNLIKIPGLNYSFSKENTSSIRTQLSINKNKDIYFKNISLEDSDNKFIIQNLRLNKSLDLINFDRIEIKTSIDNKVNNEFNIINKKNKINIDGKVFDAKTILKEIGQDGQSNKILEKLSKEIEIDFERILKVAKFPIKNFRLIGKIKKGSFEKISAKSDFSNNKHLDISLIKQKDSDLKILEVYSDIAMPLLNDYKFFSGLDGGDLLFVSRFDKKKSINELTINNFKLNNAPTLAKILTLADLKGLTDTLKGEGISFDTLSIKYVTDPSTMTINEIFMIGPSVSVLVDGYVEKKSGLISLRGTLVPAKQLNKLVSKIPVVGDILVGKKVGEGVFGLSFKIKGLENDLKTTVNPVKTLAPRFITRAVEAAKKKKAKQQ